MNEEKRSLIIQAIAWLKGWEMREEAQAVIDLLTEYELLLLEVRNAQEQ